MPRASAVAMSTAEAVVRIFTPFRLSTSSRGFLAVAYPRYALSIDMISLSPTSAAFLSRYAAIGPSPNAARY